MQIWSRYPEAIAVHRVYRSSRSKLRARIGHTDTMYCSSELDPCVWHTPRSDTHTHTLYCSCDLDLCVSHTTRSERHTVLFLWPWPVCLTHDKVRQTHCIVLVTLTCVSHTRQGQTDTLYCCCDLDLYVWHTTRSDTHTHCIVLVTLTCMSDTRQGHRNRRACLCVLCEPERLNGSTC